MSETGETSQATRPADIEMRNLVKVYGDSRALDDVSFVIPNGCFAAILGPSGSGKTTLLNAIGGFAGLDSGSILVGGQDLTSVPASKRGLGYVFQQYALFPHMSLRDNVAYPLISRGIARKQAKAQAEDALRVVELDSLASRRPSELSGGQQQRVALARALVYEPPVLLLDEPLAALDRRLRESLQVELKNLHDRVGCTFLLVTHDQEEAMSMADLIIVMRDGQIEQIGSPSEVYDRPRTEFVATFLGDCNLVPTTSDGASFVHESGVIVAESEIPSGGTGSAVIRPESLHLVNGDEMSSSSVTAVVETQRFMGREVVLRCSSAFGPLVARIPRTLSAAHAEIATAPGRQITLAWDPADIYVITSADTITIKENALS